MPLSKKRILGERARPAETPAATRTPSVTPPSKRPRGDLSGARAWNVKKGQEAKRVPLRDGARGSGEHPGQDGPHAEPCSQRRASAKGPHGDLQVVQGWRGWAAAEAKPRAKVREVEETQRRMEGKVDQLVVLTERMAAEARRCGEEAEQR